MSESRRGEPRRKLPEGMMPDEIRERARQLAENCERSERRRNAGQLVYGCIALLTLSMLGAIGAGFVGRVLWLCLKFGWNMI
jgi:hypothetical protein